MVRAGAGGGQVIHRAGVAGSLAYLMQAIRRYEDKRERLLAGGPYAIGDALWEEGRAVDEAEADFVRELRQAVALEAET